MREKLAALYALQQQDSALDAIKRAAAALDAGKAEHAAYTEAKAAQMTAAEALAAISAEIHDAELEKKSIAEKKKQVEAKMNSGKITNYKELQTMIDEVAMFDRQTLTLEERILLRHTDMEEAQYKTKEAKAKLSAVTAAFRAVNDAYKKQIETMQAQGKEIGKLRAAALKAAPKDLMPRYEALRGSRGGVAIVTIQDGNACGGCKMGLGSALVGRVKAGLDIATCDNCQRIIIVAESK